jgi:competence protein ComEA
VTREERNVLLFVALGIGIGFLPERDRTGEPEHRRAASDLGMDAPEPAPDSAVAHADSFALPDAAAVARDLYPIDVNRAGAELLEELPGIGPSKARAIIEARTSGGPFRDAEDLTRARGIGPGTVRRFQGLITFGDLAGGSPGKDSTLGDGTIGSPPDRARDHQHGSARSGEKATEVFR